MDIRIDAYGQEVAHVPLTADQIDILFSALNHTVFPEERIDAIRLIRRLRVGMEELTGTRPDVNHLLDAYKG